MPLSHHISWSHLLRRTFSIDTIAGELRQKLPRGTDLLGPAPMFRVRNRHRRRILLKAADRAQMRLQVMLVPGVETPALPAWSGPSVRVGNNLVTTIAEADAPSGISWAAGLIDAGVAEEYALGASTLEDAYIRLTSDLPVDGSDGDQ